ncbi:MAG: hypothetical protein CVU12_04445, partial [Bacteroidetes bacterium HGW-Bacteroidetes-7]
KDHYNYCRSILYKGIALFNSNKSDSIAYSYLKQSEELYNKYEYSDKILQSSIYQYLGKMNRIKKNYKEAEQYLLLSCNISTELNRNNDEYNTRLELFWTYLAQKRYKEALSNIIHFEESDMSSPEIQYSLYNALSGYYSAKNELNISIEYVKKMVKLMGNKSLIIDKPKLYYTLSSYYKRIEVQDSAIYYSKLAVLSIVDSLSTENSFYYKYLADIYASKGDYINAYNNYKNAYNSYIYTYSKITKNRVLEIEKKYDTKRLEISLLANRHDKNFFMICCLSLFCFSALMISMLIIKLRIIKKQNSALSMQNVNFKQECKKSRLINELLQISAELLIMYTDALNIQAYKHRKSSNTIFDDLNKLIDNIKSETRRKITIVANSEMILTDNPNLMSLPELSDLEKIVFVLKHYGYSSHDIAKILSTTSPRITAVNAKVKEKISKRT